MSMQPPVRFRRLDSNTMPPIPLSQIPTITDLYASSDLSPSSDLDPSATSRFNHKISLIRTDITRLAVDAIVNAANKSLLGGGGVDGAIHSAAGDELFEECKTLVGCETGEAKITGAYDLPCKNIIHAVGPVYGLERRRAEGRQERLLKSCYKNSLDLAVENECKSIAFSALSTGVYGYPSDEAAEAAINAVKEWMEESEERAAKMERVVFCQFMRKDQDAYEEVVP